MGMFDDAVKDAVPGGSLAKPLIIAAGALILAKMFGGKAASPPPLQPAPHGAPTPVNEPDGGLLGGLGSLIEKFQKGGQGPVIDSWIGKGQNQPIQPGQLRNTLGDDTLGSLAAQAGISKDDLLAQLAQALPEIINKLTPNGRLPTQAEVTGYRR